jgi:two-component system, response regulator PdtaR
MILMGWPYGFQSCGERPVFMSGDIMLQRPVILLVEDELLIRMNVADMLEGAGFDVVEATDAQAAQDILHRRRDIQVLFTDIQMPGPINGLDLAYLVRDRWPHIFVIVSSGHLRPGTGELPERAVFLTKPYGEHVPVRTIQALLEERAVAGR